MAAMGCSCAVMLHVSVGLSLMAMGCLRPESNRVAKMPVMVPVSARPATERFHALRSGHYAVLLRVPVSRVSQEPTGIWAATFQGGPISEMPDKLRLTWSVLSADGQLLCHGPQNGVEGVAQFGPGIGDQSRSEFEGLEIGSVRLDRGVEYQLHVRPDESFDPTAAPEAELVLYLSPRQS
jgi:hypothetical protein